MGMHKDESSPRRLATFSLTEFLSLKYTTHFSDVCFPFSSCPTEAFKIKENNDLNVLEFHTCEILVCLFLNFKCNSRKKNFKVFP